MDTDANNVTMRGTHRWPGVRLTVLGYAITVAGRPTDPSPPRRSGLPMRRTLLGLVGAAIAVPSAIVPAVASADDSTTATINVAVRSLTVSPASVTYSQCYDSSLNSTGAAIVIPGGYCQGLDNNISITNGSVAGHIDVQGSDAVPADNGTHWTLTSNNVPGTDQFLEETTSTPNGFSGPKLATAPACDTAFDETTHCAASAGQTGSEKLYVVAPSATTDPSTSFTTVITWTAVP